jgi:Ca2+-binding RTX toxin-like protein
LGGTYGIYNYSFTFNTGDGNDTIEGAGLYGISNKGLINTGNGKDIIIANGEAYGQGYSIENFFTIDTGDDDDIITGIWHLQRGCY